jgi:putative membrane protein
MSNGFLGNDASFMLDVVVCALVAVVPTLLFSIYLVKFKRNYLLHRNLQVTLGVVLLFTVGAFEIDLQIVHDGWENIVERARGPEWLATPAFTQARNVLWIHLVFAITTPLMWALTITLALKRFPSPPTPGDHSRLHKKLGWISTIDITLTSVTGLLFYYLAFIAVG